MSELNEVLGKVLEFDIAGKTYKFHKLTLGMLADFNSKMLSKKIKTAISAVDDPVLKAQTIKDMISSANSFEQDFSSFEGLRLLLSLSLQTAGEKITEEEFGNLITPADMELLSAIIEALSDTSVTQTPDSKN